MLAELEPESRDGLAWIDRAREGAVAAGRSSAAWDLAEVRMRFHRAELETGLQVLQHVIQEHINEPGIKQAIGRLMLEFGLLRPDGTLAVPMSDEPALVGAAADAPAEPGKIWTPGGETSAEKPGLWLPGMK
jgi:hypothetical protein